eukprot:CAMPEP_0117680688 /NCGR_PEP_ID=MMETSP0804-20121206/18505_1 /TAXON_ID=1074897 /ORGANISM="Tetraselmis astigmatica, Strain CCMP880" /LENGTH=298 /DNA_ID=CAMNT_0005490241 /DNA_START=361 /DNA_END=1258 /DNA_ORIENTATION=+
MNGEEPGNWFHGGSKCGGRAGRKGFRRMTKRQPRGALEPSVPSSSVILIKESNVIDAAVSHNSKRGWDGFGSSRQSCQLAPLYSQPSREVRAGGVAAKEHLAAVHSDNAKLFHEEVPGLDQLKCLFLGGRLVAVQIQRGPRRAAATEFTGQSVVNRRAHNGLGARGDKVAAQLCPLTAGTGAPQTPMSENEQWERGIVSTAAASAIACTGSRQYTSAHSQLEQKRQSDAGKSRPYGTFMAVRITGRSAAIPCREANKRAANNKSLNDGRIAIAGVYEGALASLVAAVRVMPARRGVSS